MYQNKITLQDNCKINKRYCNCMLFSLKKENIKKNK